MSAPLTIAHRNDVFRTTFLGGKVFLTAGLSGLSEADQARVLTAVREFDTFSEDNDPHGEHDFGSIDLDGLPRVFWKIDYYDRASFGTPNEKGSEDPSDPAQTLRVLTIMLADEY